METEPRSEWQLFGIEESGGWGKVGPDSWRMRDEAEAYARHCLRGGSPLRFAVREVKTFYGPLEICG